MLMLICFVTQTKAISCIFSGLPHFFSETAHSLFLARNVLVNLHIELNDYSKFCPKTATIALVPMRFCLLIVC